MRGERVYELKWFYYPIKDQRLNGRLDRSNNLNEIPHRYKRAIEFYLKDILNMLDDEIIILDLYEVDKSASKYGNLYPKRSLIGPRWCTSEQLENFKRDINWVGEPQSL